MPLATDVKPLPIELLSRQPLDLLSLRSMAVIGVPFSALLWLTPVKLANLLSRHVQSLDI